MAEETEIFRIELDVEALIQQAQLAREAISKLREEQKQLQAQGKENSAEFEQNAAEIRKLGTSYKEATRTIDNNTKVTNAQKGSIQQLRAELALITDKWNKLSKEERDNAEVGGKIQQRTRQLSDELKKLEGSVGDTRRNVGNYTASIKEALGSVNLFGTNIGGLERGMAQLRTGVQLSTLGFHGLKAAIASTGIGALVIALASLVIFFTKTEKGSKLLEQGMAALGAGVDVLVGLFGDLGEFIVNAFENPKQGLIDLGNLIKDNIINRFTAFKVIFDGILDLDLKKLTNGFLQLNTGVEDLVGKTQNLGNAMAKAADEAARLTRGADILKDAERELGVEQEKVRGQIDKLILTSKERTLTEKQRIENLKIAGALEESLTAKQITLARDRLFMTERELLTAQRLGKVDEELKDKKADAERALNQLINNSALTQQQIRNRESTFIKELEDDRVKRRQDSEKKILAEAEKSATEQKKLAQDLFNAQVELETQFTKLNTDEVAKRASESSLRFTQEQLNLVQALQNKAITQEEFDQRLLLAQQTFNDETIQLQIEKLQAESLLLDANSNLRLQKDAEIQALQAKLVIDTEKKKSDEIKKTGKLQLDQAKAGLQIAQNAFGNLASVFEEGTDEYKAFATLQTLASTFSGAMGAFAQASAAFPPPAGQAIGSFAAAAVTAAGLAQVAKIASLEDGGFVPRAEKGKMFLLGGQPHSLGGTKFVGSDGTRFEAEKDELLAVVNKRSTGMLSGLSNWNEMGGGVPFFKKGGVYLQDGGFALRRSTDGTVESLNASRVLQAVLENLPQPVVSVEQIIDRADNLVKVKSRAEI